VSGTTVNALDKLGVFVRGYLGADRAAAKSSLF
jgi:hypothetical protein